MLGEIKMKTLTIKLESATMIFVLMLSIMASLVSYLPVVFAAGYETAAYLSIEPNPVGVGQQVTVYAWVIPAQGYHNLVVQIAKPDGSTQNSGSFDTSSSGTHSFTFAPDQAGTWYFQLNYPGETIGSFSVSASQSPKTALVVSQQQLQPYPDFPLPASIENWTFPISGTNRLWSGLSGNWLMTNYNASYVFSSDGAAAYNPYSTAPRSAHVVWREPVAAGGLVGGEYGNLTYYSGMPYEEKFAPPIIMGGRIYYIYSLRKTLPFCPDLLV
jgi:hypothetical protein